MPSSDGVPTLLTTPPAADAAARRSRLAQASPLYGRMIDHDPSLADWLEAPDNLSSPFRWSALETEWLRLRGRRRPPTPETLSRLRRFRRRVSLHAAYRELAGLAHVQETVGELSRLADFCARIVLDLARAHWTERLGRPASAPGSPVPFCILAFGKLGGLELNFSSDIDVVFACGNGGSVRRNRRTTGLSPPEFFARVGDTFSAWLSEMTEDGFLFRVDLRLRPHGDDGPRVLPAEAIEHYYAAQGQTWERLALVKARPFAGDLSLGEELLEALHAFRYPRNPPPGLIAEVAALKARMEREVVGTAALERHLKNGRGGIREVEFFAQAQQLLHAGRYPFLQTASTSAALAQLARYGLIPAATAQLLTSAYWWLRTVEHRLQMAEERQTHELPAEPDQRNALARSLGYAGWDPFASTLHAVQDAVRSAYASLFRGRDDAAESDVREWWSFFSENRLPPGPAAALRRWFPAGEGAAPVLRRFLRGSSAHVLPRPQVERFRSLAAALDGFATHLADPEATLDRLGAFADRWGPRHLMLDSFATNPDLFRVTARLFDRSRFIHRLLCARPEIFEEVLRPEILHRRKTAADRAGELARFQTGDDGLPAVWLYTKAEQVRCAVGDVLGKLDAQAVASELTGLATAVINHLAGDGDLLVVGLGKLGSRELSFASDLDLLLVAPEGSSVAGADAVRRLVRRLRHAQGNDALYAVDLRLRPHGDAGPLATDLAALARYHEPDGGAAPWERLVLARATPVAGPHHLATAFSAWRNALLFSRPASDAEMSAWWAMRLRIERERDVVSPPERAFKTGTGGLADLDFLVQMLALRHGHAHPELRTTGTAAGLDALGARGFIDPTDATTLADHLAWLRRVENLLRRDEDRAVSVLPADPARIQALARWLDLPDAEAFSAEHRRRRSDTRSRVRATLRPWLGEA